jgi:hypothetical protein
MSQATVYGTAQYGNAADVSASGLFVGTITWNHTSEQAMAPNHIGCDVGVAIYNAKKDVTVDGIVAAKATGLVGNIGATLVLANATTNSRARHSENLGASPVGGAGVIITGGNISTTSTGFETGSTSGIFIPGVVTSGPTVLT